MGSDARSRARSTWHAGWLPASSGRTSRDNLAGVLAAAGALLLPVAMFLPCGNAATAVAFGGFVGLAVINTIKGGAILINTSRRMTTGPGPRINM